METEQDALTPFADGLWLAGEPIRILGMQLTATMTVLRLADGSLLLYSPISMTPARRAAVEAIGPITHLYAPNTFHHLHIGDWATAFPSAQLHAPRGLSKKRPDLRIDRLHGTTPATTPATTPETAPEPAFVGLLDEVQIEGFRLEESVLFHRPTRTLIVADLVHNVGRLEEPWSKLYTRAMGFYDRVAMSRMIRWTGFSDRAAARRSLDAVLELPFDRLIVGHGAPITTNAKAALATAFSWLTKRPS